MRSGVLVALGMGLVASLSAVAEASVLDHLSARSTFDAKYAPRPATLQLQSVTGKEPLYSVAGGVKYTQEVGPVDLGAFTEWQRNTAPKNEQDLVKVGGTASWQVREIGAGGVTNSPLLSGVVNWKRDRLADAAGAQSTVTGTWLFRGHGKAPGSWYYPGAIAEGHVVAWRYMPYIGVETDAEAHRLPVKRGLLSLQAQLYPLPRQWRYDVQATIDAVYRRSGRDEGTRGRDSRKIDLGLNYFFLRQRTEQEPDRAAGIGFLYSYGSDPENAIANRELRQLAFNVQF